MKPLNKKLIPYSKAFKQVSKVLGKEEALKQLGLVWDCPECFRIIWKDKKINLNTDLLFIFSWKRSPQGHMYWGDIHCQLQLKDD